MTVREQCKDLVALGELIEKYELLASVMLTLMNGGFTFEEAMGLVQPFGEGRELLLRAFGRASA
jgi:hypothetical protein